MSGTGTGSRWFTTARQKHRAPGELDDEPWGVRHAREIGGPTTACGLSAVTWHLFLVLPYEPHATEACPACTARLAA